MFIVDNNIYYIISYLFIYNLSVYLLFSVFMNSFSEMKLSNLLYKLNNLSIFRIIIIISLCSIAGIPPFIGFFLKLTLIYYISFSSYIIILMLSTLLLISLYFYLQNLRYLM